jgi:RNA polymerase sigma factor (sigma-70 family)
VVTSVPPDLVLFVIAVQVRRDDDVLFSTHRDGCSGGGSMTGRLPSSMSGADDATLARAAAAGDRVAFAEIYDRYADRLHDFCVGMLRDRESAADCVQDVFVTAATKLVQLREPDRLRSWLYAIARSEALSRIRDRKREQPSEELPDMPSGEADPATLAARGELAELIRQASGGLTDRDRVVLELAYRQGLDGPELADALGVTARNANTLVERLRDTIARSLGALLLCRRAKADPDRCPELAAIVGQDDGEFTVLMRKRVARHIDGCSVCEEDRARMVTPAALLGATPIVIPAPAWLRERTLDSAVVRPPTGSAPVGPEDDASWWPPRDLDVDDLPNPAEPAGNGQSGSIIKGRPARAGIGAALILVAIGGAAVLAAPAEFRVVPADSREPITTTSATITTTTTPSIAERTAPSSSPAALPPPVVTTTTVFVAPTTTTTPDPGPPDTPLPRTHDQTPESTPVTTRPKPSPPQDDQSQPPDTDLPTTFETPTDDPTTTASPTKTKPTKPTLSVSRQPPPVKVEPSCPPQDPTCDGGGGPIFN